MVFRGKGLSKEVNPLIFTLSVSIEAKDLPKLNPEPVTTEFSIVFGQELVIDLGSITDSNVFMEVLLGETSRFATIGTSSIFIP